MFEKYTFDTFHGVARRFTYERHKNMHEVRFHNVSIQPNIIYILLPLSTIIGNKSSRFFKGQTTLSKIFCNVL